MADESRPFFCILRIKMDTIQIKNLISELDNDQDSFLITVSSVTDGKIDTHVVMNNFVTGDIVIVRSEMNKLLADLYNQRVKLKTPDEILDEKTANAIKNALQ